MNPLYQPRFIHMQDVLYTKKFSGFTVAYLRTDTQLFFAYSLVNKKDAYVKAVGRQLSSDNLMDNIDDIQGDRTNVDTKKRVGCITIEDFKAYPQMTAMIADHALNNMTFMDFKHAFISDSVAALIVLAVEMEEK